MDARKLFPTVPKSTLEAAKKVQAAYPLGEDEWDVLGESGTTYRVQLFKKDGSWWGSCSCKAFQINAAREQPGDEVVPCKHLVFVRAPHMKNEEPKETAEEVVAPTAPPPQQQEEQPTEQPTQQPQRKRGRKTTAIKEVIPPRERTTAPVPANPEPGAPMPVDVLVEQIRSIQEAMRRCMHEGEHFGKIPGCGPKPVLLKPGAEKLAMLFRLAPRYRVTVKDLGEGHREYTVETEMYHAPSGTFLGMGVGSASTLETKWAIRWENTGKPVPAEYWQSRDPAILGGPQFAPRRVTLPSGGTAWYIHRKVGNDNPADFYNTVLKMAKKRSQVDATLTVTAASDIFTQDLEEGVDTEEPKE